MTRLYRISIRPLSPILIIEVNGELTAKGSIDFYFDVWSLNLSMYQGIIIDVGDLTEVDPIGLNACRRVFTKLLRIGRSASLVINSNGVMDSMVAAISLGKMVPIFTNRAEAVEFLHRRINETTSVIGSFVASI